FINNFLPNGGDMLRLNMAVPPTPRNDPNFSSLGIVQAAVLGLTDPTYNSGTDIQFIPNMDGFPNGRRLEDDVTRIELQAVSGVALAAIGLWYDDYAAGDPNPVTQDLLDVLTYTTGVEANDKAFSASFPYLAEPWAGDSECGGIVPEMVSAPGIPESSAFGLQPGSTGQKAVMYNFPNPFKATTTIRYQVEEPGQISIDVFDVSGKNISTLVNDRMDAGEYQVEWNASAYPSGIYFARISGNGGEVLEIHKLVKGR
ncbi:MAG TPA: DUF4331 family protein, partial [Flavilitoribacter sp.]|nr:DUF4331 family protein [Flavilitoribacter sp.]